MAILIVAVIIIVIVIVIVIAIVAATMIHVIENRQSTVELQSSSVNTLQ
jgi:F0F1-type ATP synthase membrane subunit b/b'